MINNTILINIPKNTKITVWKNKNNFNLIKIDLLNNNKKFKLIYKKENICIDRWSNSILIINNKVNKIHIKLSNMVNNFLKSWNFYFFNKIKFKGKGFRIKFYKKIKLIKFYFGKSHKTFFLLKKIYRKKVSKYKFILLSINFNKITRISKNINKIKSINYYTLRGLRSSRQIICKRKGKKGTYI